MSFTNIEFLFFLPVVFLLYWAGPTQRIYQNAILLAASYLFYGSWHWQLLLLIIAGTWLDYYVSQKFADDSTDPAQRKRLLFISLAFSLGCLGFFKYAGFFATAANDALQAIGINNALPVLKLLLPLGISYWTLQRVGYVLDTYWRRLKPASSLLDFSLFVCFFGQVAAGPISRGSELLPQLQQARRLTPQWITTGCFAFLLGYTLKAFVGEILGESLVSRAFASPELYSPLYLWLGVFAFAGQVFAYFAGYSLMAIGTARVFAIELPQNFNAPFISRSLPELWRRWHITLNRWLFEYIFTPLSTSKGWFRSRLDIGLLIVFAASGLWHGAAWTYVCWGLMHAAGMVLQRNWDVIYRGWCRRNRAFVTVRKSLPYALVSWLLTLLFFVLTLVPFRAPDMQVAAEYFRGLFQSAGTQSLAISPLVVLSFAFIAGMHLLEINPLDRIKDYYAKIPPLVRGFAYGLAVALLILIVPFSKGTFIYQQF
jgi:D-alanyl-lipoteichoic acid acyltransferase DltB (MBOAT superfamily)